MSGERNSQEKRNPREKGVSRELSATFEEAVDEGEVRLNRTWPGLLATGAVGGVDIGIGVYGLLIVTAATGNELLAALAFSIGFIALVLGNSELFTEDFLVPIVAVSHGRATPRAVIRLWSGTLVMNLAGGWVVMGVILSAFPELRATALDRGEEGIRGGIGWTTFASAIFGGLLMTLLTWMQRGIGSVGGKLTAAVAIGFLISSGSVNHAVIRSLELFGALQVGAPFGYADAAGSLAWAALGNMAGGIGLVTALRLIQIGRGTPKHHLEKTNTG